MRTISILASDQVCDRRELCLINAVTVHVEFSSFRLCDLSGLSDFQYGGCDQSALVIVAWRIHSFQTPSTCFQMSVNRRCSVFPANGAFLFGCTTSSPMITTTSPRTPAKSMVRTTSGS